MMKTASSLSLDLTFLVVQLGFLLLQIDASATSNASRSVCVPLIHLHCLWRRYGLW